MPRAWPPSGDCGGRRSSTDEMERAAYRINDIDRCYHCKAELMDVVGADRRCRAARRSCSASTSTTSATTVPASARPSERGAEFPLVTAGFTKADDPRRVAAAGPAHVGQAGCGLPGQPHPVRHRGVGRLAQPGRSGRGRAAPPRASRELRVRHYGDTARLEVPGRAASVRARRARGEVVAAVKACGYRYVTLDLEGFRSGNLNDGHVRSPLGAEHMKLSMMINYGGGFKEAAQRVVELEKAGLDQVWIAEAYSFDAISQVGYLAAKTERVEIGTGIVNVYSRTAALMAMTAAGCDYVSDGRFILGLGASGPQVVEGFHGVPYEKPMQRIKEYIEACRMIWKREEKFDYQGQTFQAPLPPGEGTGLGKPLKLINHPVRSDIPIWWASLKDRSVEATAEIADGWLPIMFIPEKYQQVWGDQLKAGLAKRDPSRKRLDISAGGMLAIGEDLVGDEADRRSSTSPGPNVGAVRRRHGRARQELLQRHLPRLRLRAGGRRHPGPVPRGQEGRGCGRGAGRVAGAVATSSARRATSRSASARTRRPASRCCRSTRSAPMPVEADRDAARRSSTTPDSDAVGMTPSMHRRARSHPAGKPCEEAFDGNFDAARRSAPACPCTTAGRRSSTCGAARSTRGASSRTTTRRCSWCSRPPRASPRSRSAMCVQRGLLDYAEPVATYWPEFAAHGKGDATVAQLLSHQCGLFSVDGADHARRGARLEHDHGAPRRHRRPTWPIGTAHGYHAITYGWLAGELIRRVDPDARSVGRFVAGRDRRRRSASSCGSACRRSWSPRVVADHRRRSRRRPTIRRSRRCSSSSSGPEHTRRPRAVAQRRVRGRRQSFNRASGARGRDPGGERHHQRALAGHGLRGDDRAGRRRAAARRRRPRRGPHARSRPTASPTCA